MTRFFFALALLFGVATAELCPAPALADCGPSNPNCIVPTAPPGTDNGQAASTAFVQAAIAGAVTPATGGQLAYYSTTGSVVSGAPDLFNDVTHGMLGIGTTTPFADNNDALGSVVRNDNNGITRLGVINRSTGSSADAELNLSLGAGTGSNFSIKIVTIGGVPYAVVAVDAPSTPFNGIEFYAPSFCFGPQNEAPCWANFGTFGINTVGLQLQGSSTGYTTFSSANVGATNYTATVPANNGILAELNLAEIWTNTQQFIANALVVDGSTSGSLIFNCVAICGTNTVTFPANTGIAAELNLAEAFTAAQTFSAQVLHNPATTIASAASATLDDINVAATTTTVTGTTNITTAKGFNKVSLYQPTITDSSAVTIAKAATLYIDNAPLAAGSITITQPWAFDIGAGDAFIQGANETTTFTDGQGLSDNTTVAIQRIVTSLAASSNALWLDLQDNNATANQAATAMSTLLSVPSGNSTNQGNLVAWNARIRNSGTGTQSELLGANFSVQNLNTGTATTVIGASFTLVNSGGGTNGTNVGAQISQPIGATTGLTSVWSTLAGILISNQNPSGAGTNTLTSPPIALEIASQTASGAYAIQQNGSGINYFASGLNSLAATSTTSGGASSPGLTLGSADIGVYFGSGAPTISAPQGSIYMRTDGSSTTSRFYINTNGSTTWTAVTTQSYLLKRDVVPANDNTPLFVSAAA